MIIYINLMWLGSLKKGCMYCLNAYYDAGNMSSVVGLPQGQYPGGASLPLGLLLLRNYDDVRFRGCSKWILDWPGLRVRYQGWSGMLVTNAVAVTYSAITKFNLAHFLIGKVGRIHVLFLLFYSTILRMLTATCANAPAYSALHTDRTWDRTWGCNRTY